MQYNLLKAFILNTFLKKTRIPKVKAEIVVLGYISDGIWEIYLFKISFLLCKLGILCAVAFSEYLIKSYRPLFSLHIGFIRYWNK